MVTLAFVGVAAAPLVFAPVPLAADAAPRAVPLVAVAPLAADGPLVVVGDGAGLLALLRLAAVGLLSRSNTAVLAVFLTGVGAGD